MKIGIVGLGSIGRRHAKHLLNSGVEVVALRTNRGELKESDADIKEVYSQQDFLKENLDGVIISNPTSLHIDSSVPYLKEGLKVFIEKPISHSIEDLEKLLPNANQILVGYCLRFSPLIQTIENEIKDLGALWKVSFYRSLYLPLWHPYADYRKEYMGRKDLGGGAVRTLSHEIDLMVKWFGKPKSINSVLDKLSDLEIDTEDFAWLSCKFTAGTRVNFELDYLGHNYTNKGVIVGENGTVEYNYSTQEIWVNNTKGEQVKHLALSNDVDNMYQGQMDDFIGFVNGSESNNATFEQAKKSMEIIEEL